ncbi:hypothetical protein D2Q93_13630 [Alicyclobacillaceae bacterium I2511]|nr:hypothetical protein D2Q93_13630 [Alicyclobacillaceae bacterium I2511]
MKVAAVMGVDGKTVVPLTDGGIIRIHDTELGTTTEVDNPAIAAQSGRRVVAVQELLAQGVGVVISPPRTFCTHSHQAAVRNGIRFWDVPEGSKWDEVWQGHSEPPTEAVLEQIPTELLHDSSHHDHEHHASSHHDHEQHA